MSCKHLIWNCYCKEKQEFCNRNLFPRLCDKYEREDEITDMKKIFNKGPAVDIVVNPDCSKKYPFMTTCENGIYKSTEENDYVSVLEQFINNLYPESNWGFFGFDAVKAEQRILQDTKYLGYNEKMVTDAFVKTVNNFKREHDSVLTRLHTFCMDILLREPHKDYPKKEYPFEFRFVLTLILGYLNKLTDSAIIIVDDVEPYFKAKIKDVPVKDFVKAVNQTRCYVKASNALVLAEGMRKFEAWFEDYTSKSIPPKELTIADIEKQLGYKIKIVGEEK